ncbi:MAG: Ig-like domain-containing protein [Gemmatimonadota bacterium]
MSAARAWRGAALGAMLLLTGCGADAADPTGLPTPAQVRIIAPATELFVGQAIQLTATALDGSGADVAAGEPTWTSTNAAVAQVSETGLLNAMAPGNATLRATIAGKSATVGVTVEPLPGYAVTVQVTSQFTPATITIRQYGTVTFAFNGIQQNVTFSTAFPGAPADIPNTTTGTVARRFDTVGDFRFESTVSPGLAGFVRVR